MLRDRFVTLPLELCAPGTTPHWTSGLFRHPDTYLTPISDWTLTALLQLRATQRADRADELTLELICAAGQAPRYEYPQAGPALRPAQAPLTPGRFPWTPLTDAERRAGLPSTPPPPARLRQVTLHLRQDDPVSDRLTALHPALGAAAAALERCLSLTTQVPDPAPTWTPGGWDSAEAVGEAVRTELLSRAAWAARTLQGLLAALPGPLPVDDTAPWPQTLLTRGFETLLLLGPGSLEPPAVETPFVFRAT